MPELFQCPCAKILWWLLLNKLYLWKASANILKSTFLMMVVAAVHRLNHFQVHLFVLLVKYQHGQVLVMSFQARQAMNFQKAVDLVIFKWICFFRSQFEACNDNVMIGCRLHIPWIYEQLMILDVRLLSMIYPIEFIRYVTSAQFPALLNTRYGLVKADQTYS